MKTRNHKIHNIPCCKRKRKQLDNGKIYFTKRENRCLKLLLKGKTIGEIAVRLNLTRGAIYDYLYSVQSKTGCCSNIEIIKFVQSGKFLRRRRFIFNKNISLT